MSLDMTSFDAALKQHYTDDMVMNMVYKDNPLLALLAKYENFGGKNLPIPIIYGNNQRRSASFSKAKANSSTSKVTDFVLTRDKDYAFAAIDNETLEASQGDANAFMEASTVEIDGAIQSATNALARDLYGNGGGAIGQVSNSSFATTTLTLTNPEDVVNFEVGMILETSTTDGTSGSVKSGTLTVVGVDRIGGTVTTSANLSTGIATIAQNDYIFPEGDFGARLKGLAAWLVYGGASATSFFGVDRSVDKTRLGGLWGDYSSMPIEEALIEGAALCNREGGRISHFFMNDMKYADLEKALGSKVQYVDLQGPAQIGFQGIKVNTSKGVAVALADRNCPINKCFGLTLSSFKLYSLGKAVKFIGGDGLKMLRLDSEDGVEARIGGYRQMGCRAPGYNINMTI